MCATQARERLTVTRALRNKQSVFESNRAGNIVPVLISSTEDSRPGERLNVCKDGGEGKKFIIKKTT